MWNHTVRTRRLAIKVAISQVLFVSTGCSQGAPEEPESHPIASQQLALSTPPQSAAPIDPSTSRFAFGPNVVPISRSDVSLLRGEWGTMVLRGNGYVTAGSHADSPSRSRPVPQSGDVHNALVLDYFVGRGLPRSEIQQVSAHASMHVSGDTTVPPEDAPTIFDWYSSVITRQVDGVPVADSFAVARMNSDGDVVSESYFWPPIDAAVLSSAKQLQAAPRAPQIASGTVRIHHAPALAEGTYPMIATIDVLYDKERRTRHYEASGAEVALPWSRQ